MRGGGTFEDQLFVNDFIMISTDKRFGTLSFHFPFCALWDLVFAQRKSKTNYANYASWTPIISAINTLKMYWRFRNTVASVNKLFIFICLASTYCDVFLWLPESWSYEHVHIWEISLLAAGHTTVTIATLTVIDFTGTWLRSAKGHRLAVFQYLTLLRFRRDDIWLAFQSCLF